jgi:hypothetical protein
MPQPLRQDQGSLTLSLSNSWIALVLATTWRCCQPPFKIYLVTWKEYSYRFCDGHNIRSSLRVQDLSSLEGFFHWDQGIEHGSARIVKLWHEGYRSPRAPLPN